MKKSVLSLVILLSLLGTTESLGQSRSRGMGNSGQRQEMSSYSGSRNHGGSYDCNSGMNSCGRGGYDNRCYDSRGCYGGRRGCRPCPPPCPPPPPAPCPPPPPAPCPPPPHPCSSTVAGVVAGTALVVTLASLLR